MKTTMLLLMFITLLMVGALLCGVVIKPGSGSHTKASPTRDEFNAESARFRSNGSHQKVTLYANDGTVIGSWVSDGGIRHFDGGAAFFRVGGDDIAVHGTLTITPYKSRLATEPHHSHSAAPAGN